MRDFETSVKLGNTKVKGRGYYDLSSAEIISEIRGILSENGENERVQALFKTLCDVYYCGIDRGFAMAENDRKRLGKQNRKSDSFQIRSNS